MRLILASASPRRREVLQRIFPSFEVEPCEFAEPQRKSERVSPRHWVQALAHFKARAVAERHPDTWVLAADTLVACSGRILGKPRDIADARDMLAWQAQHVAEVLTGLCLLRAGHTAWRRCAVDVTWVWMRDDPAEREAYLRTGDWEGKAGAYGIQTVGDRLVARIEGSYSNVVGLPLERTARLLRQAGLSASEPLDVESFEPTC